MIDPTLRKQYLTARRVQERYGITRSTIHRWMRDQLFGMPQPERRRGRLYWDVAALDAWDLARAARDPTAETAVARARFGRKQQPQDEA